jgi:hypothetical protein
MMTRLIEPAITNPIMAGVHDHMGLDASKALSQCAKIIKSAWLGKPLDPGTLTGVTDPSWFNERISDWNKDLRRSFAKMHKSRRSEPKGLTFPKALLIYDLKRLQTSFLEAELPILIKS